MKKYCVRFITASRHVAFVSLFLRLLHTSPNTDYKGTYCFRQDSTGKARRWSAFCLVSSEFPGCNNSKVASLKATEVGTAMMPLAT
jgi:hypothetical protein